MKRLVLFDFDGTLTRKDTMREFDKFVNKKTTHPFRLAYTLPSFLLYKAGILKSEIPKNIFLRLSLKGKPASRLRENAKDFLELIESRLLRAEAMAALNHHIEQGDVVAIVTGSCSLWTEPFASKYHLSLIASDLLYANNICTGKLDGLNNVGAIKVVNIQSRFNLADFDHIIAYGDSSLDREMLELADEAYYREF